jgi:hypothetical protein
MFSFLFRNRSGATTQRSRPRRPTLEVLEDRTVPAFVSIGGSFGGGGSGGFTHVPTPEEAAAFAYPALEAMKPYLHTAAKADHLEHQLALGVKKYEEGAVEPSLEIIEDTAGEARRFGTEEAVPLAVGMEAVGAIRTVGVSVVHYVLPGLTLPQRFAVDDFFATVASLPDVAEPGLDEPSLRDLTNKGIKVVGDLHEHPEDFATALQDVAKVVEMARDFAEGKKISVEAFNTVQQSYLNLQPVLAGVFQPPTSGIGVQP